MVHSSSVLSSLACRLGEILWSQLLLYVEVTSELPKEKKDKYWWWKSGAQACSTTCADVEVGFASH